MRVIAESLLGGAVSDYQLALLVGVALVAFVIFFTKLTKLMSFPRKTMSYALLVLVVLVAAVMGVSFLAHTYLRDVPLVVKWCLVPWLPVLAAALAFVAIVAPLLRLITKSRYWESLVALALSLAAVAVAVMLVKGLDAAFESGDRDLEKTRERTATMNKFLNE